MLPSDIVAEINSYGFDNTNYPDARVYKLLTRANRRLCSLFPFPFTEKTVTFTETSVPANANTPLTQAPTDIRAVRNLAMPGVSDNAGNVSYLRRDYIKRMYGGNSILLVDTPRYYYVYGRNITEGMNLFVYPYPDINTQFLLDYHAVPPVLSAATTAGQMLLPDAYSDALQWLVLAELSSSDGDQDDAAGYIQRASVYVDALTKDFEANQDSPDPMLHTDYDDYNF